MGCCAGRIEDLDIKHANSIEELIKVMKEKKDKTAEEQKQIKAHLVDKKNLVTTSDINVSCCCFIVFSFRDFLVRT